jgi:hypothetical protein
MAPWLSPLALSCIAIAVPEPNVSAAAAATTAIRNLIISPS